MKLSNRIATKHFDKITNEELEAILSKSNTLQNYQTSTRCFEELFEEAMNLIENKGKRISYFPKIIAYADYSRKDMPIALMYTCKGREDSITLVYGKENQTGLSLEREKGCLTRKRILSTDTVTMMMKGITFSEALKGLRSYEPDLLVVQPRQDQKMQVTKYS
jgi:hypothetical protein